MTQIGRRLCLSLSLCIGGLFSPLTSAEPLAVDWLYLTDSGSWLARSQPLTEKVTTVPLPLQALSASDFWWQTDKPGSQLLWHNPERTHHPELGSRTEILGESGLWLVAAVTSDLLILKQGERQRYWPRQQWHLLEWTVTSASQTFSAELIQSQKQQDQLNYAWWDSDIQAQVQYRLDLDERSPSLIQELIISNPGDFDLSVPGYSFSQVSRPQMMMLNQRELMSGTALVSKPQATQAHDVPLLQSDQPFELKAGTQHWLTVSKVALTKLEQHYQLTWNSRQDGSQAAQRSLRLKSREALPQLSGSVKIPVFDRQLSMLNSHYQPQQEKEVTLSLGQSSLVSLTSRAQTSTSWQLTLSNRSDEEAHIAVQLLHRGENSQQRLSLNRKLKAQQELELEVYLDDQGQMVVRD